MPHYLLISLISNLESIFLHTWSCFGSNFAFLCMWNYNVSWSPPSNLSHSDPFFIFTHAQALALALAQAREYMEQNKNNYEAKYNNKHRAVFFKIGDIVWLEVPYPGNMLANQWSDPYRVYARPSETMYLIHDAEGKTVEDSVSVQHLKPFHFDDSSIDYFDYLPNIAPSSASVDHPSSHYLPLSSPLLSCLNPPASDTRPNSTSLFSDFSFITDLLTKIWWSERLHSEMKSMFEEYTAIHNIIQSAMHGEGRRGVTVFPDAHLANSLRIIISGIVLRILTDRDVAIRVSTRVLCIHDWPVWNARWFLYQSWCWTGSGHFYHGCVMRRFTDIERSDYYIVLCLLFCFAVLCESSSASALRTKVGIFPRDISTNSAIFFSSKSVYSHRICLVCNIKLWKLSRIIGGTCEKRTRLPETDE